MSTLLRRIFLVVLLLSIGYGAWRVYQYFFDQSAPIIQVHGICQGGCYNSDVLCTIRVSDDYKVDKLNVWLDNSLVIQNAHIKSSSGEKSLLLQTTRLSDGIHHLVVEAVDAARSPHRTRSDFAFMIDNAPLHCALARPENDLKVFPGRTLYVPLQLNKCVKRVVISAFAKEFYGVPAYENASLYECFIPVDCEEHVAEYPLKVYVEDGVGHSFTLQTKFQVLPWAFKKQVLRKVDLEQFEQDRRLGKTEKELSDLMVSATQKSPARKLWRGCFYTPINISGVSCDFGTRRVSQERGCYTHAALDVFGLPKTVVWAPQDGIVVVKDRFAVNGNTVVIDHGCGILSLLCHLDRFADIAVGDNIRRGNPIGVTGRTGYATGDHLHWEMRVGNVPIDPMQWTRLDL